MKTRWLLAAAAVAALPLLPAQAQDTGPWLVRVRALHLDSANKDSTGFGLSISDKTFPEVDISYFFSPNVAAELILTYPQKQRLHSTVVGAEIGTFKHLPPTLTLQYHVTGLSGVGRLFATMAGHGFVYDPRHSGGGVVLFQRLGADDIVRPYAG